ncbi:MAG: DNA repair protein RecO [Armatimonadetes bacterium 55-13]|nr:DNA repair protein RecO [Armatimonadota bacterium]OJU62359.1 MAG: DNA repair protein RecO [Armatimonadetes bacterium 55-13]
MSEITVSAIVLRRKDSGESDRRLTLLTRELGKFDVVAKGAKKGGSRLSGSSDPLVAARMTLAKGKVNRFVTQSQPIASFRNIRTDFDRLSAALALVELYAAIVPFEEPFEEAFDLLLASLEALDGHPKAVVAAVWAELRLLDISGYLPPFDTCLSDGEGIREAEPWLSPRAGGYVNAADAIRYVDRFQTRAEVLVGLARTAELDSPPMNLKFADECLAALLPFWRHIAEMALPANESYVGEVRHAHL